MRFRPQQGLTIMNYDIAILEKVLKSYWFPSPTGVNYYEFGVFEINGAEFIMFPSPTGVNYYESLPTKP